MSLKEKLSDMGASKTHHLDEPHVHSDSYTKAYQGYAVRMKKDEKGKGYLERVYVGDYYAPDDIAARNRAKIYNPVITLLCAAGLLFSAFRDVPGNHETFVVIPEAMAIFLIIMLFTSDFAFVRAGEKLDIHRQRVASTYLYRYSLCCAVAFAVSGGALLANYVSSENGVGMQLVCAIVYFVCFALSLAKAVIEIKRKYHIIENTEKITDDMDVL